MRIISVTRNLCAVGLVQAQGFSASTAPKTDQTAPPLVPALSVITQSASTTITVGNSEVCLEQGVGTTQNQYLRRFFLAADHGIVNQFHVESVVFGVEEATNAGGTQPLTVNLYTIANGAPFLYANMTLIGSMGTTIPDESGVIENVAVTGSVADPNTLDLVVEIVSPDLRPTGGSFLVGSNNAGQTRPSYLAAADCGVTQPTDTAVLGFPDMHIIFLVNYSDRYLVTGAGSGSQSLLRRYQRQL